MKRLFGTFFVVVSITLISSGCKSVKLSEIPSGRLLFFDHDQSQNLLYQPLTASPNEDARIAGFPERDWPSVSPDGRTIVFSEQVNHEGELIYWDLIFYSAKDNFKASEVVHVPEEIYPTFQDYYLRWSQDGKKLYFCTYQYTEKIGTELRIFEVKGKDFQLVKQINWDDHHGRAMDQRYISPDMTKFILDEGVGVSDVWAIYDPQTGKYQEIPNLKQWGWMGPIWSPDGKYIVYSDLFDGRKICLMSTDPEDGGVTTVQVFCQDTSNYGDLVNEVEWSPNGKYLAVTIGGPSFPYKNSLTILDMSSPFKPKVTAMFPDLGGAMEIQWSPDSEWIAFFADPGKKPGLYVTKFDGSNLHLVYTQPDWMEIYTQQGGIFPLDLLAWIPNPN
jgi:Tol biopolymer transport system component